MKLRIDKKSITIRYGILIICLICWYSLIWDPLSAKVEELEQQVSTQQERIARLEAKLKASSNLEARLKQTKRQLEAAKKNLIPGTSPQLVASTLQNVVLKKASELDVEVVTYKTGSVRTWKDYKLAVVTFTVKTDTKKLVELLKSLQKDKRLYRIQNLNIVKVRGRNPHLRVRFDVEALCVEGIDKT